MQYTALYERRNIIKEKYFMSENFKTNLHLLEEVIRSYRRNKQYKNFAFETRRSKSSPSVYITVYTILNGKLISKTLRWSDHAANAKLKRGANPQRKYTRKQIQDQIKSLIKDVEAIRLRDILREEL